MLSSFRKFSNTKIAGVLVGIIILPFVFWGMGGMFSSGNTNTIAKINNKNISTQEFIDYLNNSGIPKKTIESNLDKNIVEELLSNLISSTLLDLEVKDYNLIISENTLFKICLNDESNKHIVISLKGTEKYSLLLKKAGIDVYHLEMKFFSLIKFINSTFIL